MKKNTLFQLLPGALSRMSRVMVAVVALECCAPEAWAQGSVHFANYGGSLVFDARSGSPVTYSAGVKAALYWAPAGSETFTQLGSPVPVGIPAPGIYFGGTRVTGAETAGGQAARFQVRAWSGGYDSYEAAVADPEALIGRSPVLEALTGVLASSGPPLPPVPLISGGLSGFSIRKASSPVAPTIACAADKTVLCTADWVFDPAAATDGCSGQAMLATAIETVTNYFVCSNVITCVWAVTNSCDQLYATCTQQVTVVCPECQGLALSKACPPYPTPPGGLLVWTGTVTNITDQPLHEVVVVSDHPAPGTVVFGPVTLGPGEGALFGGKYRVLDGPFTDTLTVTALNPAEVKLSTTVTSTCPVSSVVPPPGDLNGDGLVDLEELNQVIEAYRNSRR